MDRQTKHATSLLADSIANPILSIILGTAGPMHLLHGAWWADVTAVAMKICYLLPLAVGPDRF
jgi:hypothetical protein